MLDAKKGDLVKIHKIILEPDERTGNLPSSTKSVPYECWIKGFLLDKNAKLGNEVKIETLIGREISGTLFEVNPTYNHDFGESPKEILSVGNEVKHLLKKSQNESKGV